MPIIKITKTRKILDFMRTKEFSNYIFKISKSYEEFMKHNEESNLTIGIFLLLLMVNTMIYLQEKGLLE